MYNINNDYGLRKFKYLSHRPEDLTARLSHFLSVMFAEDLDSKNIGYGFIVESGSFYENATTSQRGKHKNPDEVAKLGDKAKFHLDPDPVTFKTMLAKPVTELVQSIPDLSFYRHNYYITSNRFQTPFKHTTDFLFGYSTIIVDIDNHKKLHKGEARERLDRINELVYELISFSGIPLPNGIVYTGRGLQFWWKVKPVTAKNHRSFYKTIARYLAEQIKDFIDNNQEMYSQFMVDVSASSKEAGLIRLPGSYNVKAGSYGDFCLLHDDALDIYDTAIEIWKNQKTERQAQAVVKYDDPLLCAEKREEKLIKLLKLRHAKGAETPELRDLFLFFIFNAYMTATGNQEIAFRHTLKFNRLFFEPMPEKELRKYLGTSVRKKGYKCSNSLMISWLGITDLEKEKIGLKTYRTAKQKEEAQQKKQDRDELILSLCKDGVFTEKAIAEKTGCSVATVMRVLNKNKCITKKQQVHNSILAACKAGRSLKRLRKKYSGDITESGIRYIKQKAARWRAALEEKRKKIAERKNRDSQFMKGIVAENSLEPSMLLLPAPVMSSGSQTESPGSG